MWSALNGTVVNVVTVTLGSLLGLSVASRVPQRFQIIILQCLGLVTLTLGVDSAVLEFSKTVRQFAPLVQSPGTYGARLAMITIASLILGAVMGTLLRIHDRIESLGTWIHNRFSTGDSRTFATGFLTASVIFCVGPLTILGCLNNGAHGDPSFLYVKATLDGFCSMALASTLGWGVFASILTVMLFQGGLSLLATVVAAPLNDLSLAMMTVVGGIILLATAMLLLEIKKIRVADLLPGVFLPPFIISVVGSLSPGLLLPAAT